MKMLQNPGNGYAILLQEQCILAIKCCREQI